MDAFSKYHFKDLGENETIIKVLHRNWFYLLQQFLLLILISGAIVGAFALVPTFLPDFFGRASDPVLRFAANSFMLAIWIYGFLIWIDYYFDIWIITNQRIINIEQKGLFRRKVSETSYARIEDVTTEVSGFLPTIINYGDVRVQTAAENEEFVFRTVSDPYAIKSLIVQQQRRSEVSSTEKLGEMLKEKIGA